MNSIEASATQEKTQVPTFGLGIEARATGNDYKRPTRKNFASNNIPNENWIFSNVHLMFKVEELLPDGKYIIILRQEEVREK